MLALAFPLGWLTGARRRAMLATGLVFAVIFPIQTIVVRNDNPHDFNPAYFVVNTLILTIGMALTIGGSAIASRRKARLVGQA
jgi:4-hydroxybenzoate polyprenyltransferase